MSEKWDEIRRLRAESEACDHSWVIPGTTYWCRACYARHREIERLKIGGEYQQLAVHTDKSGNGLVPRPEEK